MHSLSKPEQGRLRPCVRCRRFLFHRHASTDSEASPGKVFSRDELIDGAYGGETVVSDRTIDSHVRRLRARFREAGADPIETVHGVGYKLGAC